MAPKARSVKAVVQPPKDGRVDAAEAKAPARKGVGRADAEAVAREVLRLGRAGYHEAVLGVLGDKVGGGETAGGAAAARKAFLRISMLIHPDKLPGFQEATSAFQALVQAFDRTQAGVPAEEGDRTKHKALSRSNDGCFRTKVQCPRCKVAWGAACEGNPDYYYNFMMQGLRCFSCSTCLLNFGCFSAVHLCPFCTRPFEYSPDQYNRKITCGNPDCRKSFGFMMYHASEQALRAAREQVRAELQHRTKVEASRIARAERAMRRSGGVGVGAEAAFVLGLRDVCPRCGLELESFEDGAQMLHLRDCNDPQAHKEHRARQQENETVRKAAAEKAKAQLSAASSAVWDFSGGRIGDLHLLDEDQLKERCKTEGIPVRGSYIALLGKLRNHYHAKKRPMGPASETVPRQLQTLSDSKILAICVVHGLRDLGTREEQIEALEDLRDNVRVSLPKAITSGKAEAPAIMKRPTMLALEDATGSTARPRGRGRGNPVAKSGGRGGGTSGRGSGAAAKAKVKVGFARGRGAAAKGAAKVIAKAKAKPRGGSSSKAGGDAAAKRRRATK